MEKTAQRLGDVDLSSDNNHLHLAVDKHVAYIQSLDTKQDTEEYWLTEHLRLNGVYWGLNALHLLRRPDALPRHETIDFVLSCQHEHGGFGAAPGHDAHMLYTASAIQILATVDALDELDRRGKGRETTAIFIAAHQDRATGCFMGDEFGELDTRFICCAFVALSLLGMMHMVDVDRAVDYIHRCRNFDGGFGVSPGAESHSGQIFACLAALAIAGKMDRVDPEDRLARWLSERQLECGGLNGRPEKKEDVCYSWWVMSSLAMLGKLDWIKKDKLKDFILSCQDLDKGGLAARAENQADVFHTNFGIGGLSLLGYEGLEPVDARYCMPVKVIRRILGDEKSPGAS